MANLFGDIINVSTLEKMPQYIGKIITKKDLATVALQVINNNNKNTYAIQYVQKLKEGWGDGVSTLCVVYNATGSPVTLKAPHDYHGYIGPGLYPSRIQNGQWGGFLHVKKSQAAIGSSAAVVYEGMNAATETYDWVLAWSNTWNGARWINTVYTEILQIQSSTDYDAGVTSRISDNLAKTGLNYKAENNGCSSIVSSGSGTSPLFEAILTLQGVQTAN